ncbi:MAG: hypothetical protein JWP73_1600 [Phenylobacterium sp.]|nr:hypothetical protein [Phenylobacterium sp.]
MADAHRIIPVVLGELKLAQALFARSSLWAVCGCGREAAIDPAPWLGQGLKRQPLSQLEPRLRCGCGARRVRLEIRGLAEAPAGLTGGIHIFR